MNLQPVEDRPELDIRDPETYVKLDAHERRLIDTVKIVSAYECNHPRSGGRKHQPKRLCSCPQAMEPLTPKIKELFIYIDFVQAWEQGILATDAAFIFRNDQEGKDLFHSLHRERTAHAFAVRFAQKLFETPSMLGPAAQLEDTVEAMLAFWDDRARKWKSRYSNKQAARIDLQAVLPRDDGYELYGDLPKQMGNYPLQLGHSVFFAQRYQRAPKSHPKHRCTVFLLPLQPRIEGEVMYVRHKLLGLRPCHGDCVRDSSVVTQRSIEGFRNQCLRGRRQVLSARNGSRLTQFEIRITDSVDGASEG